MIQTKVYAGRGGPKNFGKQINLYIYIYIFFNADN